MTAQRIPMITFAIGFGLAGLAQTWSAADAVWGLSPMIGDALWSLAALAWVWLLVAHAIRGFSAEQALMGQLRNPAQGPVAALAPALGMFLGARLYPMVPWAGTTLVLVSIAVGAVFAGWILGRWARGNIEIDFVHGGYLLPTVAAGYIAAGSAAKIGWIGLGWGAFGVATLFWVLVFTLILARLALRPALPAPLVPSLAILMAPPAVGGGAWIALTGTRVGIGIEVLLGLTAILVLLQLGLLPLYRRTPFTLGAWSYTFPLGAVAAFVISATASPVWAGIGVLVVTATILTVATLSVRTVLATRATMQATAAA
ncbi:transporter [Mycetocola saprophilus]|uniref:SLAC1 family transporter n=1 Tax=Mycetocola saprophilus TaxID=76636 RepID=UPI003BF33113